MVHQSQLHTPHIETETFSVFPFQFSYSSSSFLSEPCWNHRFYLVSQTCGDRDGPDAEWMGVEHTFEAEDCSSKTHNALMPPRSHCGGAASAVAASVDALNYAALD